MSLTRCNKCEEIFDTDEFPEGYYDADGEARDDYLCNHCNEKEQ